MPSPKSVNHFQIQAAARQTLAAIALCILVVTVGCSEMQSSPPTPEPATPTGTTTPPANHLTSQPATPPVTTPPSTTTQPTTSQPTNPAATKPADGVSALVEKLQNASDAAALTKPTKEQAESLAQQLFDAMVNHDDAAALDLCLSEKQIRALYKPSFANIMARGLRQNAERKWQGVKQIAYGKSLHLDVIEVAEVTLLDTKSNLRAASYQFPQIAMHVLAEDKPIIITLGQVMLADGALRYLTLDVKSG